MAQAITAKTGAAEEVLATCDRDAPDDSLWDTGAMTDFVSPATVSKYNFPRRAARCNVLVADSTRITATEQALVTFVVVDPDGKPTVVQVWMTVFRIPYDFIIGLPTLIMRMGDCFLAHVRELVLEFNPPSALEPVDLPSVDVARVMLYDKSSDKILLINSPDTESIVPR